jgi:phage tail-like protein
LSDPADRKVIVVEIMDRFNNPKKTYKLAEAWVSKWEGSDADATSDDVAIEKITVQFEYFLD